MLCAEIEDNLLQIISKVEPLSGGLRRFEECEYKTYGGCDTEAGHIAGFNISE